MVALGARFTIPRILAVNQKSSNEQKIVELRSSLASCSEPAEWGATIRHANRVSHVWTNRAEQSLSHLAIRAATAITRP